MIARACLTAALAAALLPAAAPADPLPAGAEVTRSAATGKVRFVGTDRGRPLARPAGFGPDSAPAAVGRAFLDRHADQFGLGRGASLRARGRVDLPRGGSAVRFQQVLSGVEVLGGELVVHLDRDNNVVSAIGEAEPAAALDTWASLAAGEAERIAVAAVAREEAVPEATLRASGTALRILDTRLLGGPGLGRPTLVWAVTVGDGDAVRRLALVDARTGVVAASIDEVHEARQRTVCDAGNTGSQVPCTSPVLSEGQTYGGGVADVQAAYGYTGVTYDFFRSRFGRDSLDGAGMPLKSTVRYCDPDSSCPYANAFWNGEQMTYGQGYALADDVVGHELTHGVTEFSAGLVYWYQSGAINESMSDIFGEAIDQLTPSAGDADGDRWKEGELLPGGAIRDMANPPARNDPDSMTSGLYQTGTGDSGGVHTNSGVGNKAAFLIADGGTFNGQTVTGLGLERMTRLFYVVLTGYLTSASDYKDLGLALGQACDNLVGTNGFTAASCVEVRDSVAATAMLTDRPEAPDAAECPPGQQPSYAFYDDMEGAVRWTASGLWWVPQNDRGDDDEIPWFDATWATSGDTNMYGRTPPGTSLNTMTTTAPITVPAGGFLRFRHAHLFELPNYDGGVVEYSTDGATWNDLGAGAGVYNGTLSSANALGPRPAFVGFSNGYLTDVIPLGALAGQSVRFRFVTGTDSSSWHYGWFVDDVGVGACGPPGSLATDGASSAAEASRDGAIVVRRTGGDGDASLRVSTTGDGTATPGADFVPVSRVVSLAGDQETVLVPLEVVDDAAHEGAETIGVRLEGASGATIGATAGAVTIADDDPAPPLPDPPAVDQPRIGPEPPRGEPPVEPPPAATMRVVRTRADRRSVTLTVDVTAAGTLTVRGTAGRLRLPARSASAPGARRLTVRVALSRALRRRLRRGPATVRLALTFRPAAGGAPLTAARSVRLPRRR